MCKNTTLQQESFIPEGKFNLKIPEYYLNQKGLSEILKSSKYLIG